MEPQPICLRAPNDPALVGMWQSELDGTNLSALHAVEPRFVEEFTFHPDGTASLRSLSREPGPVNRESEPPSPTTWETTEGGLLTIFLPIAPMPEYGIRDWIREAIRYDVLAVTPDTLTISDRRYDGETITSFRRIA